MKNMKLVDTDSTTKVMANESQVVKTIQVNPRFVLQTLKSAGYDAYTAIYELIDNSKDADANTITIIYNKDLSILVIEDNGKGMSNKELLSAMDFGAERDYYDDNIGYFGVGMKTSILNLFNKDIENEDAIAYIETFNGKESSKISWRPMVSPWDVYGEPATKKTQGTRIEIHNCKTIYVSSLKKNIGVIYYPLVNSGININAVEVNKGVVTESMVEYNDPLYRHEPSAQTNFVEATVLDETIRMDAVVMSDTFDKHSWDAGKGFTYDKGGVYFKYGGRYIEYGGTFGATSYQDPWFSKTRIEVEVPKHLTEVFGVKFNKTRGIVSLENPQLDDLKRKIKDMLNWGINTRKKENTKNASDEMKATTDKLVKKLNKSAINAGFKKPESIEEKEKKKVSFTASQKEKTEKKQTSNQPTIREKKLFDVKFEDFGMTSEFWRLSWLQGTFVMTLNVSHSFYTGIYQNLNEEGQYHMLNMLASMAHAQYESHTNNVIECNTEFFWDNYWADFSRRLNHIMNS
jgi:hypothetical protein